MTTISAREFNRDVSAAKRAADHEPVVITDRGRPSHVLMSFEQYERRAVKSPSIHERLQAADDLVFEPGRIDLDLRIPDL